MLRQPTRKITLDVKHLFAFVAMVCFLIALLKYTGWIFGSANEQSFAVGGLLAFSISWLYSEVPTPRAGAQAQTKPAQEKDPNDPRSHIGMR